MVNEVRNKYVERRRYMGILTQPEVERTKEQELFLEVLKLDSFSQNQIEGFDHYMEYIFPKQLKDSPIGIEGNFFEMEFDRCEKPKLHGKILTPNMARRDSFTYSAPVFIKVHHWKNVGGRLQRVETINDVPFGNMIIPVGSKYCHTRGLTESELIAIDEDPSDAFGYYIIGGTSKIVVIQEKLRDGMFLTIPNINGDIEITFTSLSHTLNSKKTSLMVGKKFKSIKVLLNHMPVNKKKVRKSIPVFIVFKYLGCSIEDAIEYILEYAKPEDRDSILLTLKISEGKYKLWNVQSDSLIAGKRDAEVKKLLQRPKDLFEKISGDIRADLFAHVNNTYDDIENTVEDRLTNQIKLLAYGTYLTCLYILGIKKPDNRDEWGIKRIENSSRSIEPLVGGLIRMMVTQATEKIADKLIKGTFQNSVFKEVIYADGVFQKDMAFAFNSNQWGVKSYTVKTKNGNRTIPSIKKENITDTLKSETPMSTLSCVCRSSANTSKRSNVMGARMVQGTQIGYHCLVKTAEGETCGLVKYTALTIHCSNERPINSLYYVLKNYEREGKNWYFTDLKSNIKRNQEEWYPMIANGLIIGWCKKQILNILLKARRTSKLPRDCCINFNDIDGIIEYYCTAARATRPSLIVEGDKLVIDVKNLWSSDVETLFKEGCIEYIDAREQNSLVICSSISKFKNHQKKLQMLNSNIRKLREDREKFWGSYGEHAIELYQYLNSTLSKDEISKILESLNYIDIKEVLKYLDTLYINTKTSYEDIQKLIDINNKIVRDLMKKYKLKTQNYNYSEYLDELIKDLNSVFENLYLIEEIDDSIVDSYENMNLDSISKITQEEYDSGKYDETVIQIIKTVLEVTSEKKNLEIIVGSLEELRNKFFLTDVERMEQNVNYPKIENEGEIGYFAKIVKLLITPQKESDKLIYDAIEEELGLLKEYEIESEKVYSHVEINPIACMGIAASNIPKAGNNQGPRNTYQSAMADQALGVYHIVHWMSYPTQYKILANPTCAKFETLTNEISGLNANPAGRSIIVCFLAMGNNMEDAKIPNDDSEGFEVYKYSTHSAVVDTGRSNGTSIRTKFYLPTPEKGEDPDRYSALGENGKPVVGRYVDQGKCIIGLCKEICDENGRVINVINISVYAGVGESGFVDRINEITNSSNKQELIVVLRQTRKPETGNKFASRFAQKGTLGPGGTCATLPRVVGGDNDGMYADLYVSAFGMPSRMTIAWLIEGLVSKSCIKQNIREDATTFEHLDIEKHIKFLNDTVTEESIKEFSKINSPFSRETKALGLVYKYNRNSVLNKLIRFFGEKSEYVHGFANQQTDNDIEKYLTNLQYNFVELRQYEFTRELDQKDADEKLRELYKFGNERMCHPNGRMIETPVFIFPCFYQALKHQVSDKTQVRGKGSLAILTRQPVPGRKREGGPKQGEMERDSLISMGCSSLLDQRFRELSDPYKTTYCERCGARGINDPVNKRFKCFFCEKPSIKSKVTPTFGVVSQTYVYNLLQNFFIAYGGIVMLHKFAKKDKEGDIYHKYNNKLI